MTPRSLVALLLAAVLVAASAAVLVLRPSPDETVAAQDGFAADASPAERGEIIERVETGGDAGGFLPPGAVEVVLTVRLADGSEVAVDAVDETGLLTVGRQVEVANVSAAGLDPIYGIVDLPRGGSLSVLALLFVGAVVALGRWHGVRALLGLAISALLVMAFAVPAIIAGRDPVVVAVITSLIIMLTVIPLAHGTGPTAVAAAAGTTVTLALTVPLSGLFVRAASLTGLADEDIQAVLFAVGREIDVRGLLLAGIVIGTLGVLDDVTVSQAAAVRELRAAAPQMPAAELFTAAIRVGRDHIAATVNTLFLAYTGAALPLLVLFSIGGGPLGDILSSELVAQEIVRTLAGSIGLVAAVPVTTALALLVMPRGGDAAVLQADQAGHSHAPSGPAPEGPVAAEVPSPKSGPAEAWESRLREAYGVEGDDPQA